MFLFQDLKKAYFLSMELNALNRFSRLEFKNGKSLHNRVVVPPMASETADEDGFATEKTISHYSNLAKSRAGLIMVEYTYTHSTGRSEVNQLGIQSDAHILGLQQIVKVIHASGALAGIQLTHAGGKTNRTLTGGHLMAPSQVPVPVKDQVMETPDAMSTQDIQLWKTSFIDAAKRAQRAGFDFIEFHAAHGYGLNQWLSPLTNRRADSYGGSLINNSRLLFEIIEDVRRYHSTLLLAVRMPGQDFLEGGLKVKDTVWIAKRLETLGIDLIDVSSGIGGWRRPRDRSGEGYLISEAAMIQKAVAIPVIGVGGIEQGSYIDDALSTHKISLAAVGRAILKEPEAWGTRNL